MPIVTIQQSPGRTKEQRQKLIKKITEAFEEAYGLSPEAVFSFKILMILTGGKTANFMKIE